MEVLVVLIIVVEVEVVVIVLVLLVLRSSNISSSSTRSTSRSRSTSSSNDTSNSGSSSTSSTTTSSITTWGPYHWGGALTRNTRTYMQKVILFTQRQIDGTCGSSFVFLHAWPEDEHTYSNPLEETS